MVRTSFFHLYGVLLCRKLSKNIANRHDVCLQTPQSFGKCHFFRTQLNLHCSIVFCTKPCDKKGTFRPQKELRRDQCSMRGFGGHIAISHDVTRYPVLVIARTDKQERQPMTVNSNFCDKQHTPEIIHHHLNYICHFSITLKVTYMCVCMYVCKVRTR